MNMTNEALSLLKRIAYPRMIGSEGIERAKKEITDFYDKNKIPFVTESFECYGYDDGNAEIYTSSGSFRARPVGNQNPFDVEGELLFIDNYKNIKNIDFNLKDKILLATGGMEVKDFRILNDIGVKGYIIISPPQKDYITSTTRQVLVKDNIMIPSVIVKHKDAMRLLKHNGKSIRISGNNRIKKVRGENIIVISEGTHKKEPEILVFGHYDSVYKSPGATDNGGGTAIVAELAKQFVRHPAKRGIRFILFSGEEFGLLGSKNYVKSHEAELKTYKITINIDVAGDIFGTNMCRVIGGDDIFYLSKLLSSNLGYIIDITKDIYSSDSMPFALEGIPSINIARWGGKSSFNAHTINDKARWVGKNGIEIPLRFAYKIIDFISNSPLFPTERTIPEDLIKKVKTYFKKSGYIGKEKILED